MLEMKVTILVLVLVTLFNGLSCQFLTCRCKNAGCGGNAEKACAINEHCFVADIKLRDNSIREDRGCMASNECHDIAFCPARGGKCVAYGCCDYDICLANRTIFPQRSSSPPPTLLPAPTSTFDLPMLPATSSIVPMATKAPIAKGTSSLVAKMTSEPAMPSSENKMSVAEVMTSAQPEIEPTSSMEKSALIMEKSASTEKGMESSPSGSMVYHSDVLVLPTDPVQPSKDLRPPCDKAGRMLSVGAFVMTAVWLLLFEML